MDRNKVLHIIETRETHEVIAMLEHYCVIEHNKPLEDTRDFINKATRLQLLWYLYDIAISYYKNKYNIIDIYMII